MSGSGLLAVGDQALVGEQACELLGVQGVAAGPLQQQGLDPDGQHRPAHQGGHQPRHLEVGQRPQRDPGRGRGGVAPARVPFQQLGTGRGQDQQWQAGGPLDQVLEELEHRRVGPVQVLDHQHQRVVGGHGLHEPAPGGEQLVPLGLDRVRAGDPEQRGQPGPQPLALRRVGEEGVQGRPELARHLGRWVGLEDAGLGLDDLAQGPEGDPVAIGQAAALAPGDQLRPVVDGGGQLADEAGLADPRLPDDRDQPHGAVGQGPLEQPFEQVELGLAADEGGAGPADGLDAGAAAGAQQPPHRHRVGLALDPHRPQLLELEQPARRPERRLPHHHPTRRRHPLQPRGRVHHITHHALGLLGRVRADQGLAGGDADPDRQVELLAGGEHAQRAADRPLGVVLVGDGGAEHGHDAVADELVQGAAQAFDLGPQPDVVGAQQGADVLGVGLVGAGGEAHQVTEQHRDQAAFLGRGPGRGGQRRAAGPAEPEAPRVVLSASCAARHGGSLRAAHPPWRPGGYCPVWGRCALASS